MKTLFFDVETTGLPPKGAKYDTDYIDFPYIVQIAWQLCYDDKKVVSEANHIVAPNGWKIPEDSIEIHGITNEKAIDTGIDLKDALRRFIIDSQKADKIVAHNVYFDTSVIKACMLKLEIDAEIGNKALSKEKRICTMMKTIKFVEARYRNADGTEGRIGKWPSLDELYFKLFKEEFVDQHDAMADVRAVNRCYWELIKLGILS
jgi:DNA polymerase III epsilon subunit-like protein